ncbi:MAG: L-asparaginase [Planctomycetota bacterium]
MGRRRIYVAYTGGTIGMTRSAVGYKPEADSLLEMFECDPVFRAEGMPELTVKQYEPLLDSSNMVPADWARMARDLVANAKGHDGFLVVHGTDTMAYTASALSFMLEGLDRPVLLTGSQIPLEEPRSDAHNNLVTSLMLLERYADRLHEVCVCFGGRLLRGNRTKKIDAEDFAAFDSPNLPHLGRMGIDFDLRWDLIRQVDPKAGPLTVHAFDSASVAAFRLFPGLQARYLESLFSAGIDGLVLECYGAGNAPHNNKDFLRVLREATDAGVVIVDVPQPIHGCADLSLYETGRALLDVGVVGGFDMTPEASLAKLSYLFARGHDPAEVRQLVQQNLRGELTPPEA